MSIRVATAVVAAVVVVVFVASANGRPPSAGYAPSGIADVLAHDNDAQSWNIVNVSEITLDGIRATAPWNNATSVTLDQDVEAQASDGDPGARGGDITLKAGYGDDGNTAATYVTVQGGRGDSPGYLVIETGEGLGNVGDCLVNVGGGRAAWRPCP